MVKKHYAVDDAVQERPSLKGKFVTLRSLKWRHLSGRGLTDLEGSARLIDILYHKVGGHKGWINADDFFAAMKNINSVDAPKDAWDHLGLEGYDAAHDAGKKKRRKRGRKIKKTEFVALAEKYRLYMNARDRHIQDARHAVLTLKPYTTEVRAGEGYFTNAPLLAKWLQKTQHRPTATDDDGERVLRMLGYDPDREECCPLERADELESCARLLPEATNFQVAAHGASVVCSVM